ncbi:MAG: (d)CMP kinase [Clostridiales bacterium]|nr:(d)CMP kinase [Clostridiales bacterium]
MKIAIDGPGGAGKSTVAKRLADELGMTYIDTGAMYRAVALAVHRRGLSTGDADAVRGLLGFIRLGIAHEAATGRQLIYLNGEDVSDAIRTPQISLGASDVSKIPEVRLAMVELQRGIASGADVVMDGRDIGTFVFPDASRKYFLTASPETRARRRFLELTAKGQSVTFEQCLSELLVRDENDSNRAFAPLKAADDALLVETDDMTEDEVVAALRADLLNLGLCGAGP